MHFCRAQIALGGDRNNIFHAGHFAPVSWPEILLLQFMHGDDAIDAVEPFTRVNQTAKAERRRLIDKYGEHAVLEVFARQNPSEMEAPRARLSKGLPWFNPITMSQEVTGEQDDAPVVEAAPELEPVTDEPALVFEDEELPQPTRRRR